MRKTLCVVFSLVFLAGAVGGVMASGASEGKAGPLLTQAPANFNDLVTAAQKEGQLTVIALPHDWVNYGEAISTFSKKYGIKINELNPDGGSGDEIEAIKANKDNKGPQAPDVIDVGLSFGPDAKAAGLLSPYKVKTWDTIPDAVKDADGYWYGDYYGALAFEVNMDVVKTPPLDWEDLLNPEFKGKVALSGDPADGQPGHHDHRRRRGGQRRQLRQREARPGVLRQAEQGRQLRPLIAVPGTVDSGETPVTIRWDYNALSNRDKSDGNPTIGVIIPATGVVAGVYVQAISAYAPHPKAARLWMEFLYSDEGQIIWLKGYGHPVRYANLAARNVIPAEVAAMMPPAASYAKAVFPTIQAQTAAKQFIADNWDSIVNVAVQKK